jgi:hypothetical protein
MKIKLNVQSLSLDEDYEIAPAKEGTPLTILVRALALALEQHPDLRSVKCLINQASNPDILFPEPDSTVRVDVVLCDKYEDIPSILDNSMEPPLGVFATSSGLFDREKWYADTFRVIVALNERKVRENFRHLRALEMNPKSDMHDQQYLEAYLNTLTHELVHAVEFITHGGGLTPEQVDGVYEDGLLAASVEDVCSGRGLRTDMPAYLSDSTANAMMEDRVEAKGREWLEWAIQKVPAPLVDACLKAYAPKARKRTPEATEMGL